MIILFEDLNNRSVAAVGPRPRPNYGYPNYPGYPRPYPYYY